MSSSVDENNNFEEQYTGMPLLDAIMVMHKTQAEKDAVDERSKLINKEFDYLRLNLIPRLMDEAGVPNITVEGVGRVGLTSDMYVSIKSDHREAACQWLKDTRRRYLIWSD